MKMELHRALEDLHDAVKAYNLATHKKNMNEDIWELENERDYFRFEALKYFEENKLLNKKIEKMKEEVLVLK